MITNGETYNETNEKTSAQLDSTRILSSSADV